MRKAAESCIPGVRVFNGAHFPWQAGDPGAIREKRSEAESPIRRNNVRNPPAVLSESPRDSAGAADCAPIPAHSRILAAGQKKELP